MFTTILEGTAQHVDDGRAGILIGLIDWLTLEHNINCQWTTCSMVLITNGLGA
jgi:hypothetical protein